MNILKDFLVNNYQLITIAVGVIFNIILCAVSCKKNGTKLKDCYSHVLEKLPAFISEAENLHLSGREKLNHVLTTSINYLAFLSGCSIKSITLKYSELITFAIENILATPQKKG